MRHEHDQHEGMLGRQSGGASWEDGKSVSGVVGVIRVEVGFRKKGQPQLVIQSSSDVKHPSSGIEWKVFGILVRPETVSGVELDGRSPGVH